MGVTFHIRRFACFGFLSLLWLGGGCSESPSPTGAFPDVSVDMRPRAVPFVQVLHGADPGEAEVRWLIINWANPPIEEYLVAVSPDGPITEENWGRARILDRFPWKPGHVAFREIYGADEGLTPGDSYWFAVRARDAENNLSRLETSPRLTLTTSWWMEGHVRGIRGAPLADVQVTSAPMGRSTTSDAAGFFRIGPFRSIDREILTATGPPESWYRCIADPVKSVPAQTVISGQDFFLLPRFLQDENCTHPLPEFLDYFRRMTYTTPLEGNPAKSILHRWDSYPLSVHIPAAVNREGSPMDDAALAAVLLWNNVMGEEYFIRTEDRGSADIEFHFEEMENHYGLVTLLAPAGDGQELGRVIPEKMKVTINPELSTPQSITEVSLHELGHVLGLLGHSSCYSSGYLMVIAGGFGCLGEPEPVHADERRAIEAIRYLPQGQDMAAFDY